MIDIADVIMLTVIATSLAILDVMFILNSDEPNVMGAIIIFTSGIWCCILDMILMMKGVR